ncbi:MAG: hypothetical protein GYA50_06940 [Eubacteriaceae bacterium]|nr:hypothetical protein [Eubacteriaceae bacterium]
MENDAYSIKELVNMIYELKIELAKTQTLIQKYNGLREKQTRYESAQDEIDLRLKTVEDSLAAKKETKKDYQWILGVVIAFASLVYAILK